jgi:hypothetical protein
MKAIFGETVRTMIGNGTYWPCVAAISAAAGAGADVLVWKLTTRGEYDEYDGEEGEYDDEEGEYDVKPYEYDGGELPDIPEGVNEISGQDPEELFRKPSLDSYIDYTKFGGYTKEVETPTDEPSHGVELISAEEFVKGTGNLDGYASVTGTYFTKDGILAGWNDELEEKIPEEHVGMAVLEKFDDPSVESVYVRNDVDKVLFEIIRCDEPFDSARAEAESA